MILDNKKQQQMLMQVIQGVQIQGNLKEAHATVQALGTLLKEVAEAEIQTGGDQAQE